MGINRKLGYNMVRKVLIKLNVLKLTNSQTQQQLQDHRHAAAGEDVSGSP